MTDAATAMDITAPIDLSARVKLRYRGADRVRFLNGQVSNDVRKVDDASALPACVCTLKGKLDALIYLTASGSGDGPDAALLVDGPPELRADDALFNRFDRYLIADDVELDDVSAEFALWHFLPGVDRPDLPGAVWKKCNRFGVDGHDLWLSADSAAKLVSSGTAGPLIDADSAPVEALRIRHRVPRWGTELSGDILPAEARLDLTAVDFHKGCYTGQEVVSRIKSVGRVNRLLCLLQATGSNGDSDSDAAPAPAVGDAIFAPRADDPPRDPAAKPLGHITSVSPAGGGQPALALGFVRREFNEANTKLVSVGQSSNIEKGLEVREV